MQGVLTRSSKQLTDALDGDADTALAMLEAIAAYHEHLSESMVITDMALDRLYRVLNHLGSDRTAREKKR